MNAFPTVEKALAFDKYVAATLPPVKNRPDIFGEQTLCNAQDECVGTLEQLLATASSVSIDDVVELVRSYGGVAIPAHIDRPSYSVLAALGDVPPVGFTAIEITARGDVDDLKARCAEIGDKPLLLSSDAHCLENINEPLAYLELEDATPDAIIAALNGEIPCRWSRG